MSVTTYPPSHFPVDADLLQPSKIAALQTPSDVSGNVICPKTGRVDGVLANPNNAPMNADTVISIWVYRGGAAVQIGAFTMLDALGEKETEYYTPDAFTAVNAGEVLYLQTDGAGTAATAGTFVIVIR